MQVRRNEVRLVLVPMAVTLVIVALLGFALLLRGQNNHSEDLLREIRDNQEIVKQVLRNQTENDHRQLLEHNNLLEQTTRTIVCILSIEPANRDDENVKRCQVQARVG